MVPLRVAVCRRRNLLLLHDIVLTIGLLPHGLEFDLSIIAAILTIIGYSLNDTVVIYDRIRENLRKYRPCRCRI